MRAILIDPEARAVSETALPDSFTDIRRRLDVSKLVRVATLPNGDRVYVSEEAKDSPIRFRLGHSETWAGHGLVLGKRAEFGFICDAATDLEDVEVLAQFDP